MTTRTGGFHTGRLASIPSTSVRRSLRRSRRRVYDMWERDVKGQNAIAFNEATMIAIVQHYFDSVLFKDGLSPEVVSIEKDGQYNISIRQRDPGKTAGV